MENKSSMGTQSKIKSTRITNMGLPFRRYSMPETVMRKYSLKRQRSVQSPTEFGLLGTKDQGCQTDLSVFTGNIQLTTRSCIGRSSNEKMSPILVGGRLGMASERTLMRCSRCNRSSERRHSYSCKYNIICSKCKHSWRKTSLPVPVSVVSVSKGSGIEIHRKSSEICRKKPILQSGSSPENRIQFDIGKIIERSSDIESDFSREADTQEADSALRQFMADTLTVVESDLTQLEPSHVSGSRIDNDQEKLHTGDTISSKNTSDRAIEKMFEEKILKMLDTYCPHMQCTLNMFMGAKRPHSEGSVRSQTSSQLKRPKSASARLPSNHDRNKLDPNKASSSSETESRVKNLNEQASNSINGNFIEFHNDDSHTGTQNILIIDHDNISSAENTPGSTTRECDSCQESCPKCCSQDLSDAPRSASCCCTSPDTTIEMKTSSGSGLTSSSGTLDQTVSDHTGSTQDSTLSITSVTPEDKIQRLKSTSPLPIVLSSECILMNPIIPEQEDLNTTGSSQQEETKLESSDSPFPTVINSETTLMEPLEKGYVSKKDMHNYSVHFLDSGHSDSSDDVRKQEKEQKLKLGSDNKETQKSDDGFTENKINREKILMIQKLHEDVNGNPNQVGGSNEKTERPRRDRRKSTFCLKVPPESHIPEEEKTDFENLELLVDDSSGDPKVIAPLTNNLPRDKRRLSMCGTDRLNRNVAMEENVEDLPGVVRKESSQESQESIEKKTSGREKKVDMCTQCSGFLESDEPNEKNSNGILKKGTDEKRRGRREKREAKIAEVNDMVNELEIVRQMPISTISASTYYEGERDEFLVPRYSAAPSSISMFVNTSSEYSSDSDLSFADSLEDRLSPLPMTQIQTEFNRYDNRLVRGEVTEIKMINECKHKRRMKKCYAYFVTLSGEQTSISVTTMPESLKNRLIMKEKQIRYHCHRKHSKGRVYCRRSVHRLCSKHRAKQKQTQTSPPSNDVAVNDASKTTVQEVTPTTAMATSTPKTATVKAVTTTAVATLMTPTLAVSKSVQTIQDEVDGDKTVGDDQKQTIKNYDRIMIGFCSNNVETSIYYSQDIKTTKNAAEIKREVSITHPKSSGDQSSPPLPDQKNSDLKHKEQDDARSSRRNIDVDEEICQILLAGLEDQNSGRMVFVEEKQTFYSKSNIKKISSSAQTLEEVKDTATLTDLSYDCQKTDRIANKVNSTSASHGSKKKLTALQKSEETLEKLQKINESLRKEIHEAKLRCNQGTQVNLDNHKQEPEPELNGSAYGNLLHHSSNFKQTNFTEYRRLRQEPSRNSSRTQASKSSNRLVPPKGVSKRASNLIGSKFRQKFEAIPEEKSSGSFDSTEDSADVTPRDKNGSSTAPIFSDDHGSNIKICRSATDCRLNRNDVNDQYLSDQQRRHTIGNLVVSDPGDVVFERSTERRRNTIHGNVSVSNTQTLVNTEHLKRSTGNLNMNVSRRTGHQIIGKRTSMMVGRFEQVKNGDGTKMSQLEKYKGRAALESDEQEELLTLSRGWINFYLLRGDSQEVTSENGIHEEVIGRNHSASPADYLEQQTSSQKTTSGSSPEDQIGQYTVHIHAAPEPSRHSVKFPGVGFTQTPSNRNAHIQPDDIILPDITSPPQSSPSSATPSRSPLQPKVDPQTLPSLSLPNGMRNKPRKSRHTGCSSLNFKHADEQRVPGFNQNYDADLSPPNTPKSIMSRSGELACSEQSITSSSCGSESPKFLTNKRWSCQRHRKNLSASANNSWTVTVAGNQEASTDVEMKLAFSHSQQDKQRTIGSSSQQWTLTVNSGKQDRGVEKPRHENFHCLPDLDVHNHIHKKGWKWKDETPPSTAEQFSLFWPAVQEIIEKNMILQNSARLDPTWSPEKTEDIRSNLSVTGWAITPEKKPRVPTQSERDLTRAHCPRVIKQRQYNFA